MIARAVYKNPDYIFFDEATNAFNNGVKTTTHLYNAMSPLHHRNVGLVGAAMLHHTATASCIPDGIHISYEALQIAKKQMGERLYFITDAVTNCNTGPYQHIFNTNHYVVQDGTLSGSALTMLQCVKNAVQYANIELAEALRMCNLYPATVLGIDHYFGKMAVGYDGPFLQLNERLELVKVI